jgi:hypothetical protein
LTNNFEKNHKKTKKKEKEKTSCVQAAAKKKKKKGDTSNPQCFVIKATVLSPHALVYVNN